MATDAHFELWWRDWDGARKRSRVRYANTAAGRRALRAAIARHDRTKTPMPAGIVDRIAWAVRREADHG